MSRIISPKFCELCASPLHKPDFAGPSAPPLICSNCGHRIFYDPKLAVATVLEHADHIVLLRRAQKDAAHGRWIMPGGHVDRGEVVPEAAVREVREETGLKMDLKGLLGVYSYPDNPIVLCVYWGISKGGTPKGNGEALELGFFTAQDLPWQNLGYQSTTDALKDYLNHAKA